MPEVPGGDPVDLDSHHPPSLVPGHQPPIGFLLPVRSGRR